jgi:hypothetical protein
MALNPVERRLALLCGEWDDFRSDTSKRLLVWQVPENAMRLLECFFEVQKLDLEYSSRDLFIVFEPPYEHSLQYSRALKEALCGQYEASREDLVAENLDANWSFDPANVPDSPAGVMAALRSFGSSYHKTIGHLAAVLLPTAVADDESFASWALRALALDSPEGLRLLVVDSLEHPRFPQLTPERDARIMVQRPSVEGLSLAQETFAQEQTVGPAGVFRNLMMGVVSLLEKGSADQVKAKATDAVTFARQQGWADQEVVIEVLVAGSLLKESRHQEAIGVYRATREAATRAVGAAHPAGYKLVLQTWFGEAGACLAAGDALGAARCYDEAGGVAQEDHNPILSLEAFRMGAFCRARAGDTAGAMERGQSAMRIGATLEPEARLQTTLPLAAVDLLRLLEPDRVQLLERCKGRLDARLAAARDCAEARAVSIENDPGALRAGAIEAELERESAAARAESEAEIGPILAAARAPFRQQFMRTRDLLGASWPLQMAAALPAPVDANAQGAAAS